MKNLLPLFLLLSLQAFAFGQNTFVKTIDGEHYAQNVRVFQTADQGVVVFSLDSLKLFKMNSCGQPEWGKQYAMQKGNYAGDILQLQNGNFALLNRVPQGQYYCFSVAIVNSANGNLLWSQTYEDAAYTMFPYTLSQDSNGDLFVFGNSNHIATNQHNNFISKISLSGNHLWTRFYDLGPIWGGGVVCSDNSIVGRFGSAAFKTDASGNLLWAINLANSSYYLPPVEVADGYIFTGTTNSNNVSFQKISKQGNLLWGGRKVLEFTGVSSLLYRKSNGNFVGIFRKQLPGKSLPAVIEFDKELNFVRQQALNFDPATRHFNGRYVGFSDENTTVFGGTALINSPNVFQVFFARLNNKSLTTCDTTFTTAVTLDPVTTNTLTSASTPHTFTAVARTYAVKTLAATVATHCSNASPAAVNIRKDSLLCPGSYLMLKNSAPGSFNSYLWSTGETTPTIAVTKPGKYWLRATSNCGASTASDTVTVTEFTFPQPDLTTITSACFAEPVAINAEIKGGAYRWQNGSTNPVFYATRPGTYEVDITYQTCTKRFSVTLTASEKLLMPNIFTPNADGYNDHFVPIERCGIASGSMKIYNRWGQLLYTTSDLEKGWNGRVNGQKTADGIYYYLLEYADFTGKQKNVKGWVELVGS